jgi:hypothetical protein
MCSSITTRTTTWDTIKFQKAENVRITRRYPRELLVAYMHTPTEEQKEDYDGRWEVQFIFSLMYE